MHLNRIIYIFWIFIMAASLCGLASATGIVPVQLSGSSIPSVLTQGSGEHPFLSSVVAPGIQQGLTGVTGVSGSFSLPSVDTGLVSEVNVKPVALTSLSTDENVKSSSWWDTEFKPSVYNDVGAGIVKSPSGDGYLIGGYSYNDASAYGPISWQSVKIDLQGKKIWNRTYTLGGDRTMVKQVLACTDGGYLLAGQTAFYGWGYYDSPRIIRIDDNGAEVWDFRYSTNLDTIEGIVQLPDKSYIATGYGEGTAWSGAYLIRLSKNGTVLWEKPVLKNGILKSILLDKKSRQYVMVSGKQYNSKLKRYEGIINTYWFSGKLRSQKLVSASQNIEILTALQNSDYSFTYTGKKGYEFWIYNPLKGINKVFPGLSAEVSDFIVLKNYYFGCGYKGENGWIGKFNSQGRLLANYTIYSNVESMVGLQTGEIVYTGSRQIGMGYNTLAITAGSTLGILPSPAITAVTPTTGYNNRALTVTITGKNFRTGAVVQMIKGTTVKKATLRSLSSKKIVCVLPTKGVTTGRWDIRVVNTDGTSVKKLGCITVKRGDSASETGTEPVSGGISGTAVSGSPATSLRGSIPSGGILVPMTGPVVSKGIAVF